MSALWQLLTGRNPYESSMKSCSYTAFSMRTIPAETSLSLKHDIPKGRCLALPGFGMDVRRTACGMYAIRCNRPSKSDRLASGLAAYISLVSSSMPAAASLRSRLKHPRVWGLLKNHADEYIYDAVKHGIVCAVGANGVRHDATATSNAGACHAPLPINNKLNSHEILSQKL